MLSWAKKKEREKKSCHTAANIQALKKIIKNKSYIVTPVPPGKVSKYTFHHDHCAVYTHWVTKQEKKDLFHFLKEGLLSLLSSPENHWCSHFSFYRQSFLRKVMDFIWLLCIIEDLYTFITCTEEEIFHFDTRILINLRMCRITSCTQKTFMYLQVSV